MININSLVTGLTGLLRLIPDLVANEMAGDATRIRSYCNRYPDENSLIEAVHDLPAPGMLVAHTSTGPGSESGMPCVRHEVTIYVRARAQNPGDAPSYWNILRLVWKGVPTGHTEALGLIFVVPDCLPFDLPTMIRQSDVEGLDYFAIQTAFNEQGDS
jgi:hypothetical protein